MRKKNDRHDSSEYIWIALLVIVAVAIVLAMMLFGGAEKNSDTDTSSEIKNTSDTSTDSLMDGDIEDGTENGLVDGTPNGDRDSIAADTDKSEAESDTEAPPPEQTIPIGVYKKNGDECRLITEYQSKWPADDSDPLWKLDTWTSNTPNLICDVTYFAVFTSEEELIDFTYWDETFVDRWEACGLDDSYKIGFEFNVYLENGRTERATVLGPEDTFALEKYFELYLYDCVAHAHDSWYSHITENTNYDDTKNVMVKVTLRNGCYDVAYIELTAFVYKGTDEFDSEGCYIGANKASLIIEREE